jgi:hypothetical protein
MNPAPGAIDFGTKSFFLRITGWFPARFFEVSDERLDEFGRKLEGPLHNPSEFGADSRGVEGNYLGVIQVPMDLLAEGSRNRSEDSANE